MEEKISKQERRMQRKIEKEENKLKARKQKNIKKILNIFYTVLILVLIGWVIFYFGSRVKLMPPTIGQGHSEEIPEFHIMDEPMPDRVQKHMMEHADGSGDSGFIIQYNCTKFDCEDDLVDKLKSIAEKYPKSVYLVPTSIYDGKIILTTFGKIEVLDDFDEDRITNFITK